jgi:c-di-GMP-related signal transduction protein
VREALERARGVLGRMLLLAEKQEEGDRDACFALIVELPGLDTERVNAILAQAMAWANNLNRSAFSRPPSGSAGSPSPAD